MNTDARGSSSATHRVYCKDCGQYVYECPQSEWRQEQNEIRGNLLRGRTERIDFSRSGERAEVSELIHSFPQALRLFMRQRPDEEFDLHQNEQVLQDCVDLIRETAEAGRASSSATLENTITAFLACAPVSMTSTSTLEGSRRTIDDEESKALFQHGLRVQSVRHLCSEVMMRNDVKSVLFVRYHNRHQP